MFDMYGLIQTIVAQPTVARQDVSRELLYPIDARVEKLILEDLLGRDRVSLYPGRRLSSEAAMAETNYLIIEKYHVLQRWEVWPADPEVLTPTALVDGLRDGTYNLNAADFTIKDRQSGETVAKISLELEARSDISFGL